MTKGEKVQAWRVLARVHGQRAISCFSIGLCGSVTRARETGLLTDDQAYYLRRHIFAELVYQDRFGYLVGFLEFPNHEHQVICRLMWCDLMALAAADEGR